MSNRIWIVLSFSFCAFFVQNRPKMARVGSMEGGGRQIPPLSWPAGGSSWSSTSAQNVPKIDIECEFFCLSLFDRVLDRFWNPEPIQISWLASKAWDDVGGEDDIAQRNKYLVSTQRTYGMVETIGFGCLYTATIREIPLPTHWL